MNFIYISPEFPVTGTAFITQLRAKGVTVLGIGESPYDGLPMELRNAMTEYYRVDSLQDYDQVLRAVAFFTFRYGKIDWLESNNEFWLEQDAQLRRDFHITTGFQPEDMERVKRKSQMKEVFRQAGIPVCRGQMLTTPEDALSFTKEVGYPVIAKPDIGVGASQTYKFMNEEELLAFFADKPDVDMFMEEFVPGEVVTYDGIVDAKGETVREFTLECPVSIMDIANLGVETMFYSTKGPAEDVAPYGRKAVKAFGVKSRYIHFEFFRLYEDKKGLGKKGDILGLEVNMRPPGGFAPHMHNMSNNTDCFRAYADMVTGAPVEEESADEKYYTLFLGRRHYVHYAHSEEKTEARWQAGIQQKIYPAPAEAAVMSDIVYIFKTHDLDELYAFAAYATQHA